MQRRVRQERRDHLRALLNEVEAHRQMVWQGHGDSWALAAENDQKFKLHGAGAFVSVNLQAPTWISHKDLVSSRRFQESVLRSVSEIWPSVEFAILFFPWEHTTSAGYRIQRWESGDYADFDIIERFPGNPLLPREMSKPKMSRTPSGLIIAGSNLVFDPMKGPISEQDAIELTNLIKRALNPNEPGDAFTH